MDTLFFPIFYKTQTAIHRALAHGHLAIVQVLLDNGARSIGFASDNTVRNLFAYFIRYCILYNFQKKRSLTHF